MTYTLSIHHWNLLVCLVICLSRQQRCVVGNVKLRNHLSGKIKTVKLIKHHNNNGPWINTNNTIANTTFPNSWDDLSYKLKQPNDFEAFLNSDLLAATPRNEYKTLAIVIYRITGSVSTIASTCLVVHILHSHHVLSTTYHRLVVFGLSIADIMSSFGFVLSSTRMAGGAKGNELFCTRRTR